MGSEELRSSRKEDIKKKVDNAEQQMHLDEYMRQREQYYKQSNRLTEDQERKQLEKEFDEQLTRVAGTQEKKDSPHEEESNEKKDKATQDVATLLDGIKMNAFETPQLGKLESNTEQNTINGIPLSSAHGISLAMQLYGDYTRNTANYFAGVTEQYATFQTALEKYKKLESEYDVWTRMSDGGREFKDALRAMQKKVDLLKEKFEAAQRVVQDARQKIDAAGVLLNDAPEGLIIQEDQLQEQTQTELAGQHQDIVEKTANAEEEKAALLTKKEELIAQKAQLDAYQQQIGTSVQELTIQKSHTEQAYMYAQQTITSKLMTLNSALTEQGSSKTLTLEELQQLVPLLEKSDIGAITALLGGEQNLHVFQSLQNSGIFQEILDAANRSAYFVGLTSQLDEATTELTVRGNDVQLFGEQIATQSVQMEGDIALLDEQITQLETYSDNTIAQYEEQAEQYETRRTQQDQLDQHVAGMVMDTNITIAGFESSAGVYATTVGTVELDEPGGWTMFYRGTIGRTMQGVKRVVDGLHTVLTYIPNKINESCVKLQQDAKEGNRLMKIAAQGANLINQVMIQPGAGVIDAAAGLLDGVATMIEHPVDTLVGLGTLIGLGDSPAGEAWSAMGTFLFGSAEERENNTGRTAGKAVGNIASFFIGAGEVNAVAKAGQAGRAAALAAQAGKASALVSKFRYVQAAAGSLARSAGRGIGNGLKAIPSLPGKMVKGTIALGKSMTTAVFTKTGRAQLAAGAGNVVSKVKQGVAEGAEFVKNNPKQIGALAVEMTTGFWLVKGVIRMSKGEPFFGKFFKDAKAVRYLQEYDAAVQEVGSLQGTAQSLRSELTVYMDFDEAGKATLKSGQDVATVPRDKVVTYNKLIEDIALVKSRVDRFAPLRNKLWGGEPPQLTELGKLFDEQIAFRQMIDDIIRSPEDLINAQKAVDRFNKQGIDLHAYGKVDDLFEIGPTGEGHILVLEEGKVVIKNTKLKPEGVAVDEGGRVLVEASAPGELLEVTYTAVGEVEINVAKNGGELQAWFQKIDAEVPVDGFVRVDFEGGYIILKKVSEGELLPSGLKLDMYEVVYGEGRATGTHGLPDLSILKGKTGQMQQLGTTEFCLNGSGNSVGPIGDVKSMQVITEVKMTPKVEPVASVIADEVGVVSLADETTATIGMLETKLHELATADAVFYELNIQQLSTEIQQLTPGTPVNIYGVDCVYNKVNNTVKYTNASGKVISVSVDEFARTIYTKKVKTLNGGKGFATAEDLLRHETQIQVEQIAALDNGKGGTYLLSDGTEITMRYNKRKKGSRGSFEATIGKDAKVYSKQEVVDYILRQKQQRMIEQQRVLIQAEIDRIRSTTAGTGETVPVSTVENSGTPVDYGSLRDSAPVIDDVTVLKHRERLLTKDKQLVIVELTDEGGYVLLTKEGKRVPLKNTDIAQYKRLEDIQNIKRTGKGSPEVLPVDDISVSLGKTYEDMYALHEAKQAELTRVTEELSVLREQRSQLLEDQKLFGTNQTGQLSLGDELTPKIKAIEEKIAQLEQQRMGLYDDVQRLTGELDDIGRQLLSLTDEQMRAAGLEPALAAEVGPIIVRLRRLPLNRRVEALRNGLQVIFKNEAYKRAAAVAALVILYQELFAHEPGGSQELFAAVVGAGLEPPLTETEKIHIILNACAPAEIKTEVQANKELFRSLVLIPNMVTNDNLLTNTYVVNFNLLQTGEDNPVEDYTGRTIDEQKAIVAIRSIGLGDLLDEGTSFTVTDTGGNTRLGTIKHGRPQDDQGKYIPIRQGDTVALTDTDV